MHRAAVLGSPVAGSLSPALHRAAYAELGLDWTYTAVECTRAELAGRLRRLAADHDGLSVTIPLKTDAAARCAGLAPLAAELDAVNTLLRRGREWWGENTDVAGVVAALSELPEPPAGRPVLVLGAGGAARAVLAALAGTGCGAVRLLAREPARGAAVASVGHRRGLAVVCAGWPADLGGTAPGTLVVSAVPPAAGASLLGAGWPAGVDLFDLAYRPWPTPLAAAAAAAGAPVVGGLAMLVAQAVEQVELMTGRRPDPAVLLAAGQRALADVPPGG